MISTKFPGKISAMSNEARYVKTIIKSPKNIILTKTQKKKLLPKKQQVEMTALVGKHSARRIEAATSKNEHDVIFFVDSFL